MPTSQAFDRENRLALIRPPTKSLTQSPPLQLAYLAACMAGKGWEAGIFDFNLPGVSRSKLFRELMDFAPSIAGISCMTVEFDSARKLTDEIKKSAPGAAVALGGVHPTALPELTLKQSRADFAVAGEGEKTIVELGELILGKINNPANVRGLVYRDGGGIRLSTARPVIADLDSIPFPKWDMIDLRKYSIYPWQIFKRREIVAPILTSRGCPFRCAFCASVVSGKKVRFRSAENVVSEMEYLVHDFGVGEFQITDDNFTARREHACGVCEEITKRKLKVVWKTPNGVHISGIDDELAALMKESGCYQLGFGIESGSSEILKKCNKNVDLSTVREKIRIVKKYSIEVYGFFILGLPGENKETVRETIEFMKRGFDHVSLSYCVPYPGSELFEKYCKHDENDWSRFVHHNPFKLSELSEADLRKYMRAALIIFYSNPRRAFGLARKLSLKQTGFLLKLLRKYLV